MEIITKAFISAGKFNPVFFFTNGKVLISPIKFSSLNEALACKPHDKRLAVSRREIDQTFKTFYGTRELLS